MRTISTMLVLAVALTGAAHAKPPADQHTPHGLAKKGGVPPGLAKHFGKAVPARAYIAVDPRHDDRACFLVGDRWVMQQNFEPSVRAEVRGLFSHPPLLDPPPIPLPRLDAPLRVIRFG